MLATSTTVAAVDDAGSTAFSISDADPFGTNPGHELQIFKWNLATGAGVQITSFPVGVQTDYNRYGPSVTDDGQRIAYLASQGSVDGRAQIAGVLEDGTGFHWITSYSGLDPGWKQISGNGQSVAFQACSYNLPPPAGGCWQACQVVLVEWYGTGLKPLDAPYDGNAAPGWAGAPDITDDAQTVFYAARNFGVYDIWRIHRDRTGWMPVTNTWVDGGICDGFARVAGGASRLTFDCRDGEPWGGSNPDLSKELYSADANGTNHRQLSDTLVGDSFDPDITPGGGRIVFASSANPLHEPGTVGTQIYRMDPGGSDLVRLTSFPPYIPLAEPSVSDDGLWIAFSEWQKVYTVGDDGTMLTDLLPGVYPPDAREPHIASDGTFVVFASQGDLLHEGLSSGRRIYRVNWDATGLARVSAAATDWSEHPRLDETKTWVVYRRAGKIRRTRLDGTVDEQITTLGQSDRPDPTPGADLIVYQSTGNPLGTNADGNTEIFLWQAGTNTTRQLTSTTQGHSLSPRISRDGLWVTFWSDAEFFGGAYSEGGFEPHRIEVAAGRVERIAGLARCASPFVEFYPSGPEPAPIVVDRTGALAVHGWPGDCAGTNRDGSEELFVIDRLAVPRLFVSAGPAPTVVTWDVEPGPERYDLIRGDVASLTLAGDGTVDLGVVFCAENDSADASTANAPDPDTPLPGQVFFYMHRGSAGPSAGPGSYGRSSAGGERTPSSGGCPG